ncbi:MAG: oxidoreductase [Candidatus Parabeggiatoa sp. nov. 2]|nr:MAG: oxidoreductase [Beggiatoa sp. 4572_84]RKZ63135.1 MAG: oxidoreductase [Gammaproteobacteria bacterium]
MNNATFKALWVTETPAENSPPTKTVHDRIYQRTVIERNINDLPAGDLLIKVIYSSLNYKDALSAEGHKGVTRQYPHTPGIDAAGIVAQSNCTDFKEGQKVLVTGYDLGMNTAGGFAEYIRVPAAWVMKLPKNLSLQESMIYGTAGFTAALSIFKLQHSGLKPEQGEVLVTGATGGVGSIAVALLAKLGFSVIAATGKTQSHDFLRQLGAKEVIGRDTLQDKSKRPMLKGRWAGVLDTVGGNILATALKSTQYGGHISCCGLVASAEFSTSVFPFILRGINLLGVDSVEYPMTSRSRLWQLIANEWKIESLQQLMIECDLTTLNTTYIDKILQGQIQGRVVVKPY